MTIIRGLHCAGRVLQTLTRRLRPASLTEVMTMTLKTKNADIANEWAFERRLSVGLCVYDGYIYAGTAEELAKIGCVDVREAVRVKKPVTPQVSW